MPDRGHRGRHAGGLVRTLLVPILLSAGCLSTRVADLWEKQPDRTAVFAGDYRDLSVCVADALRHSYAIGELDYEVAPGPGERQSVTGYTQAPYYRLPTVDFTFAQHGDKITVETRRGVLEAILRADREVAEGMIFMPFCFAESPANRLTNPKLDPFGKIPEFKYCAARVERATD